MNIVLGRDDCNDQRTLGTMTFPDGYVCQTLEDPVRPDGVKIANETAIPSGTYPVTITMSARFGKLLPLISEVPNFSGIRIHSGNTTADTSGCILVGTARGKRNDIIGSRVAMEKVQGRIAAALTDANGVCTIDIIEPSVDIIEPSVTTTEIIQGEEMIYNSKPLWRSKTLWANVLSLVLVAGSGQLGVTLPHAPEILAVANVILRLITTQGVSMPSRQ